MELLTGTGGDALADCLLAQGVTEIFGIPGVQLDPAMDALYKRADRLHYVCARNEQATTYMADGYARATGSVGVAMVVPGPGTLNALAGLATAYAASSPVLLICAQINSRLLGRGYGALHEIPDQTGILRGLTKWAGLAREAADIPGLVRRAFYELRSGRPQPVAIEVPVDVLAADVRYRVPAMVGGEPATPPERALDAAAAVLRGSERPTIFAGGGARSPRASAALTAVAEALEAPVVVSENGRGAIDARHRLAFDGLALRRFREDADVVLAVGTRLVAADGRPVNVGTGDVVMINADASSFDGPRTPQHIVHGDAAEALESLAERLFGDARPDRSGEFAAVRARCDDAYAQIQPQRAFLSAIRRALPENGVFVSELTQIGYVANICFPTFHANGFIGAGYQGTLGFGFATALGAKVGRPDVPVVSVTGDGGFAWTMQELSTAKRFDIALATVLFNDGHYGNVRRIQQTLYGGRVIATDLTNPDYRTLASAYGIEYQQTSTPDGLEAGLRRAFAGHGPTLIEVQVGEFPDPWPLVHLD